MGEIALTGRLVCQDAEESDLVAGLLPTHIALTRAEPGCLMFEVAQTSDPLVWQVEERFESRSAFQLHQKRATASAWGRLTAEITRDYTVTGLTAE